VDRADPAGRIPNVHQSELGKKGKGLPPVFPWWHGKMDKKLS